MKKAVKKALSVMLLFALTVTLHAGVIGTLPSVGDGNGGISVLSDEEGPIVIQY